MENNEVWKIIYYNNQPLNYSVSNKGQVKNNKNGYILKGGVYDGYRAVSIAITPGQMKHLRINRLVAQAFIPNPLNKPYVNHKDGNRMNNNVENLEWVTPSENSIHAYQTGLRYNAKKKKVNQYNLQGKYMMTFESLHEAELQTGTPQSKITEACQLTRRTAGEYQWRYFEGEINDIEPIQQRKNIKKKVGQYTLNGDLIAVYDSYRAGALAVNGTPSAISRICANTPGLHTHKGFVWKIVDDIVQEIDE